MKNIKLFLLLSWIPLVSSLFAQDFAPLGATWHYTQHYAFSGNIDFFKIESVKDTIIGEKNCKKLEMNYAPGCTGRGSEEFVYEDDSVVYFYDKVFDECQVLFNYKAKKDSSWYIKQTDYVEGEGVDTLYVKVDSTDILTINERKLKRLFVTYAGTHNGDTLLRYHSQIVQIIGDISYLFNLYPIWSGACDIDYPGGLRCYSDEFIGNYETGIADSCTYQYEYVWKDGVESQKQNEIQISPNPTSGQVSIITGSERAFSVKVQDLSGRVLLSQVLMSGDKINISTFKAGIYVLTVETDIDKILVERIVKY